MTHQTLVTPEQLAQHLSAPDWVVIDCRFELADPAAGRAVYAQSHVPGARYAHLDDDLSSPITPTSGRHPLPNAEDFCRTLGAWGVGDQTQVVAYDDAGGAFASRLWWLLRWIGHRNAAVLDGGYSAWLAAGQPTSSDAPKVLATTHSCRPDCGDWLSADEVTQGLSAGSLMLLDARAPERYRGEVEPIDPVAGHVPGAINFPFKQNLDAEGRFLPREALRARFEQQLAGKPLQEVVHMCGSGVTACHNLLAMEAAGLEGSRLYPGSWSEWCRDPSRGVSQEA